MLNLWSMTKSYFLLNKAALLACLWLVMMLPHGFAQELKWKKEGGYLVAREPWFYVVIIASKPIKSSGEGGDASSQFSSDECQAVDSLLQHEILVTSRHDIPPYVSEAEYYDGVNQSFNFLAVYAGKTKSEAAKFLKGFKAQFGKWFPDANLRRIRRVRYTPDWD